MEAAVLQCRNTQLQFISKSRDLNLHLGKNICIKMNLKHPKYKYSLFRYDWIIIFDALMCSSLNFEAGNSGFSTFS